MDQLKAASHPLRVGKLGYGFDYKGKDYKDQIQGPNLILVHGEPTLKDVFKTMLADWNNAPTRMQVDHFTWTKQRLQNLCILNTLIGSNVFLLINQKSTFLLRHTVGETNLVTTMIC